jgi:transcriptional regulator with XRE-family HTH domain
MQVKKSPLPTDQHVGNRVRMRRLMLDMNQTELADAVGVTFQQVQKYEKGTNRISASRLQQISKVLMVQIPFFFDGLPRHADASKAVIAAPTAVERFLATSNGLSLVRAFVRIQQRKLRRSIVELVEELVPDRG